MKRRQALRGLLAATAAAAAAGTGAAGPALFGRSAPGSPTVAEALRQWSEKLGYEPLASNRFKIQDTIGPCDGSVVVISYNPVVADMNIEAEIKRAIALHQRLEWEEKKSEVMTLFGRVTALKVAGLDEAGDPAARHYECIHREGGSTYMSVPGRLYQDSNVVRCGSPWSTGNVSCQCPALSLDIICRWNRTPADIIPFLQDFIRFYHNAIA